MKAKKKFMQISGPLWMSEIFGVLLEQLVCVLLDQEILRKL
jgi:hypothetical protein